MAIKLSDHFTYGRLVRFALPSIAMMIFISVSYTHLDVYKRQAQARLTALDEHTDLGSGMRIAMRDLEIRGAGSLMGAEQSGNMSAVGLSLIHI